MAVRDCTADDFKLLGAENIYDLEVSRGAAVGNLLCPEDWSLLAARNSKGQELDHFKVEFRTCGDSADCTKGQFNFPEFDRYF